MQARRVTATIHSDFNLKQGVKAEGRVYHLGAFEVTGKNNESKIYRFVDASMRPTDLVIDTVKEFDLNNKADNHNWMLLKIFNATHGKEMSPKIVLHDPQEAAEKEAKRATRSFNVHQILMNKREDKDWLTKVYRRVIGVISAGLTSEQAFSRLYARAAEKPDDFYLSDTLVFETAEFENMALIDLSLEKGVITRDGQGNFRHDGKVIGKDYAEVIFAINKDPEVKAYILRRVSGNRDVFALPLKTETDLPDDIAALVKDFGEPLPEAPIGDDYSTPEKTAEEIRADVAALVDTLIEVNLIETDSRDGKPGNEVYRLEEFDRDQWFKKPKLIEYFLLNQAERLKYESMLA